MSTILVVGMSGTPWLMGQNDFNAVLAKPCTLRDTLSIINQLLKK